MKIAVLLTSFNRKEKTLNCLRSLKNQKNMQGITLDIFLTDDASTDGTAEAVKLEFPDVKLFNGNGFFFWAGGMRNSWREACHYNFDFFLLLNDDTLLNARAIRTLVESNKKAFEKQGIPAICVGSTSDSESGGISYGGKVLTSKLYLKSKWVYSADKIMNCDLGNANIMLVPGIIVKKIGILSDRYTHGIADYDYTLKAKRNGFEVIVAPGVMGRCTDDHGKNWKSGNVSLSERIKYLKSPKGLAYKEYLFFIRTYFPFYLPFAFVKLWLKTFFPFIWDRFKTVQSVCL